MRNRNSFGMPNVEVPYKGTSQIVKKYFIELLGKTEAKKLMAAMKQGKWIVISGPRVATGKTTLCDILRAIGYTRVVEEWMINTIQVSEPLVAFRERNDIFESLGISLKD